MTVADTRRAQAEAHDWWIAEGRHPGWYPLHNAPSLPVEEIQANGYKAICSILCMNGVHAHPGDGTGMVVNIIMALAKERDAAREAALDEAALRLDEIKNVIPWTAEAMREAIRIHLRALKEKAR